MVKLFQKISKEEMLYRAYVKRIEEIEANIDGIPGIISRISEAECVEEVISYASTYLDPFKDMNSTDIKIIRQYVTQIFNEYWSLV